VISPVFAYIDPTGGLPPSLWSTIAAAVLAALAAGGALARLWGRQIARYVVARPRTVSLVTISLVVALLAAGALMGWMAFGRKSPSDASASRPHAAGSNPRVLVLAFDGLDPQLLERYMSEGRLPNFSKLAGEGIYHPLATIMAPQSPVAWSTFITGADPGSHGVFDFIRRDPKTYKLDLSLADRRNLQLPWKGTPIWQRPTVARLGMTAQRLPMIFPPPKMNGRLLAGMGVWDIRGTEGTYLVFSTSRQRPAKSRGLFFPLERRGNTLHGELPGPYRAGQADKERQPFVLAPSEGAATLTVQNREHRLTAGRWSDWIDVEFRLGPLGLEKVPAITRAMLRQSGEDVTLYVSPLEFDPRRPLYAISHPTGYSAELADALGLYSTRGMPFDTQAANDGELSDDEFLEQAHAITDASERMLRHELDRFERGVLFAYFEATDIVQHLFWRTIDAEHPLYASPETARHRDVIPKLYEECDAILGRAKSNLGPGAQVVVLSDHGFAPFRWSVHLNSLLRDLGYLRTNENPEAELLAGIDWQGTKAYAVGFNSLYLNLAGREGQGVVPPGDYAATTRAIARVLEQWKDPASGARPIANVYLARQLYQGDSESMPDLIVGYARGYRASWETALGSVPQNAIDPNKKKWSGDHCIDFSLVPGVYLSSDRGLDAASLAEVGQSIDEYLGSAAGRDDSAANRGQ